jgi:hypothetical protein
MTDHRVRDLRHLLETEAKRYGATVRVEHTKGGHLRHVLPHRHPAGFRHYPIFPHAEHLSASTGRGAVRTTQPHDSTRKDVSMAYDLKKYTGEHFLKPDDVRDGPLPRQIAGLREGKFGKLEAIFDSGEILSLNATNTRILLDAYGDDGDALIGKEIELFLGQIRYAGTDNDAVLVKPLTPSIKKAKPAEPAQKPDADDQITF